VNGEAGAAACGRRGLVALVAALLLAACGRRGRPEAPENADPAYPRPYPNR
jgi:hypothetical protein